MPPKFGTSGLRGLVTELTETLVQDYTRAFLMTCEVRTSLFVARDLRNSSKRIMADVISAARQAGMDTVDCGAVPTPALALAAQAANAGAVMITGSHIPANRNGLKFYTRQGEITKVDEASIRDRLGHGGPTVAPPQGALRHTDAAKPFAARYLDAFGSQALVGRRIGLYSHSAVGRDLLAHILTGLGAEVVELGRSDTFVPVDTEAVDPQTRAQMQAWVTEHALDALVSTDGDSDRPLVVDEQGQQVPGDLLGQITAQYLQAGTVVTPVSSNSGVQQKGFDQVILTRIGSPFVISAMQEAGGRVVGFEANGGFLLGFRATGPNASLPPLMTRDCVLPIVVPILAAAGGSLSSRVALEPPVVTAADRLQDVPLSSSQKLMSYLESTPEARRDFLAALGLRERSLNLTDGLRMHLAGDTVLHIRPSGNAPELRIYVQARTRPAASALLEAATQHLRTLF